MWFRNNCGWGAALLAALLPITAWAAIETGDPLPEFADYQLQGELPDLAGKVVLLDLWASWCPPCKASFPAFDELQAELGEAGLVILAVSVDRKERAYTKFLERMTPGFATVLDANQKLVADLEPTVMPTSYLFGRDGRLRAVHTGFRGESTVQTYRTEIAALLREGAR